MVCPPDLSFSRTLPTSIFNQLGELLEQMAQAIEDTVLVFTDAVLTPVYIPDEWQKKRFIVMISQKFSVLLVGNLQESEIGETQENNQSEVEKEKTQVSSSLSSLQYSLLKVRLTFNSEAITSFLLQLRDLFGVNSQTHRTLNALLRVPGTNDPKLQSQFTLLILEYFLPVVKKEDTQSEPTMPAVSVCQPVEDALQKQIAQERLLNQVTTQIRKSLDLTVIMATALVQVREFLDLDRLLVYKFEDSTFNNLQQDSAGYSGCIVYEVLANHTITSVLNYQEKNCFAPTSQCWEKYRQGFTLAVNNIEKTYALDECLLNLLRGIHVQAKFVAPIVFEEKLWGLLIAHQCTTPYDWSESEKKLLAAVAEQLAIAIHQAELMRSLHQEKQTLEQRVVERTMALHDALVAAEAANRLRSEFLATISHELLTPLTCVIGMSSTLLRWSFGELSKRQRDYLQTIHDSGEHLLGMIHDILDLSQIEAGKAVLNISEFSLTKVAEAALDTLLDKAIVEQVNVRLDLQINPQRDRFTADARRVQQILRNLLSNAIKFTPEGGDVTLRLWVEDGAAVFQVEDTGIGIPEEKLPRLFEIFHQLDTPYRRRYGGTGLGLALTKQLVELHRGRIEVESTVSVGSIFTVWIPNQMMRLLSKRE
jgi:two-component system sensor histidine kinase/response regulator